MACQGAVEVCEHCATKPAVTAVVLVLQVMSYGASAESAAITTIFTRMLQHSLKDSHGLSQHPAATGAHPIHLLLMLSGTAHLEIAPAHSQKLTFTPVATDLKQTLPSFYE